MKVVGTKLDNADFERFQKFCNDEGLSKSEIMRGLIRQYCDACEEEPEISSEIKHPTVRIVDD